MDICHYYVNVSVLVQKSSYFQILGQIFQKLSLKTSVILFKNCKMITSNIQNIPNPHIIITCWHEDGIKAKKCCN